MSRRPEFKYGASSETTTLDAVGNDLDKMEQYLLDEDSYVINRDHPYVGQKVENGGKVVSVVGEMEEDYFYVIAVIFEDPTDIPIIVE